MKEHIEKRRETIRPELMALFERAQTLGMTDELANDIRRVSAEESALSRF